MSAVLLLLVYAGFPLLALRLRRHRAELLDWPRLWLYGQSMAIQWGMTVLVLWAAHREGFALGLGTAGRWGIEGAALATLLALVAVAAVAHLLARPPEREDPLVFWLIPESSAEKVAFVGLALTAGFCEEVLYRGFAYGRATVWLPGWIAAGLATASFALTHLYQGWYGVLRAMVLGAVLLAAFAGTGSLWPAIGAHFALDLWAGFYMGPRMKRRLHGANSAADDATDAATDDVKNDI